MIHASSLFLARFLSAEFISKIPVGLQGASAKIDNFSVGKFIHVTAAYESEMEGKKSNRKTIDTKDRR